MFKVRLQNAVGNVGVAHTDLTYEHFARVARGLNFTDDAELQSAENAVWDPNTQTWCNAVAVDQLGTAYETFSRDSFE